MIPHQIGYQNIEDQKPFEWHWDMMEEDAREMKVRIVLFKWQRQCFEWRDGM